MSTRGTANLARRDAERINCVLAGSPVLLIGAFNNRCRSGRRFSGSIETGRSYSLVCYRSPTTAASDITSMPQMRTPQVQDSLTSSRRQLLPELPCIGQRRVEGRLHAIAVAAGALDDGGTNRDNR
jgi:hypothetical protein